MTTNFKKGYLDFVYGFLNSLQTHEITLSYEGEFNHEVMKSFTSITEGRLSMEEENGKVIRKVYHVMVECLQNITRHAISEASRLNETGNQGVLIVSRNDSEYQITTGNLIESNRVENLRSILEEVNTMIHSELDEHYKKQLREGHISDRGGAGLGFIDIRRKTNNLLEYHFLPVQPEYAFFLLTSTVSRT